jgi:hypothetical protein
MTAAPPATVQNPREPNRFSGLFACVDDDLSGISIVSERVTPPVVKVLGNLRARVAATIGILFA